MELILIRHGLPEHVETQDGTPADPPLSETGHEQARRMANWLDSHNIHHLYASPMRRAMETAQPLSEQKQLDIQIREGVAEYDRKAKEYIPVEKIKELDYERWKSMMADGGADVDFPPFFDEVVSTITDVVSQHRGESVAIVCHGGVINAWAAHVLGLPQKMFMVPDYTSISRFMVASSGEKSVITLNEHSHLTRQ